MATIIAITNQKGGVGKTTSTLNIAAGLAQQGKRVLCIDFDPQCNFSDYAGYDEQPGDITVTQLMQAAAAQMDIPIESAIRKNPEGFDFIPSNLSLSTADLFLASVMCREKVFSRVLAHPIAAGYDYILVDCLPSLGVLLTNALAAADQVLIPVQAQKFSVDGLSTLLQIMTLVKGSLNPTLDILGFVLTMKDNTNMSAAVETNLQELYGDLCFSTHISRLVEASESTNERRSMVNSPGSRLGAEYISLVKELLAREEK